VESTTAPAACAPRAHWRLPWIRLQDFGEEPAGRDSGATAISSSGKHELAKALSQKLTGEKTEQTVDSLSQLWGVNADRALAQAQRLVEVGFFEQRGSKEAPTFGVPFLFRDALSISQGLAE